MLVLPAIVCMAWLVIKHAGRSVLGLGAAESAYSVSERLQVQAPAASGQHVVAAELGAVRSTGLVHNPFAAAANEDLSDCQLAYALGSFLGDTRPLILYDFGALGLRKIQMEWTVREKVN